MLPPLDALSVAAAVVQFVDFGAEIISAAKEICDSAEGATQRNSTLKISVIDMEDLSKRLKTSSSDVQVQHYPSLFRLAETSEKLSGKLIDLLKKIEAKNPTSRGHAFIAAIKAKLEDGKMKGLQERLDECRKQIGLELQSLTRCAMIFSLSN